MEKRVWTKKPCYRNVYKCYNAALLFAARDNGDMDEWESNAGFDFFEFFLSGWKVQGWAAG